MFIHRPSNPIWYIAHIYPFIDAVEDAATADSITVDRFCGVVRWHGSEWTPDEFAEYVAKLQLAFDAAFEIAKEVRG